MAKEIKAIGDPASLFEQLRLESLQIALTILRLPNGPDDFDDPAELHKRLVLQANVAMSGIANAIKVDDQALRAQEHQDIMAQLRERMERAQAKLPKPKAE